MRAKGFKLPMGPLGFGFPDRIRAFLAEAGRVGPKAGYFRTLNFLTRWWG